MNSTHQCFIMLSILFFLAIPQVIGQQAKYYSWQREIRGEKDFLKIEIFFEENSNSWILSINKQTLDLEAEIIFPVYVINKTEKRNNDLVLFHDLNKDGIEEIIISSLHPFSAGKRILRIFQYKYNAIHKINFESGFDSPYKFLIGVKGISVVDINKDIFYCATKKVFWERSNGQDEKEFYSISAYQWDSDLKRLIYRGEKLFETSKLELDNINWYE